jgi:hypothetical protein
MMLQFIEFLRGFTQSLFANAARYIEINYLSVVKQPTIK